MTDPPPASSSAHSLFPALSDVSLVRCSHPVFLAPAIVALFADPDRSAGFCSRLPLADQHLRFPQLADDLFGRKILFRHFCLSPFTNPNSYLGSVFGGQVTSGEIIDHCIKSLPFHAASRPIWSPLGDYILVESQGSLENISETLLINKDQNTYLKIGENVQPVGWMSSP